jgi:hypothetical protein
MDQVIVDSYAIVAVLWRKPKIIVVVKSRMMRKELMRQVPFAHT